MLFRSNDADSSGTMKYVRIEFAGAPFSPGNERNCLSLMGVGSATTLEYIQCHRGYDDGFEIWGGAVNMKYLVATGNRDDQFDYADGWIPLPWMIIPCQSPPDLEPAVFSDVKTIGLDAVPCASIFPPCLINNAPAGDVAP